MPNVWGQIIQIYPASFTSPIEIAQINIKEKIEKHDVFILLFTDANLRNFDNGFTDFVYNSIYGLNKNSKQGRIDFYINQIKNTPDWFEIIKNQAKNKNKTIDEALKENAEYMVYKGG